PAIEAGCVEIWIDDGEMEALIEKRLLIGDSCLDVIDAFHVVDVGAQSGVGEGPVLADGFLLKVGRTEISERISAGIVIVGIAADKSAEVEQGGRIDGSGPGGSDVKGFDLRALIG